MNKRQLIDQLAHTEGVPRVKAEQVVNLFWDAISQGLINGERAEIRGFGSFKIKEYEGYTGRNPMTGEQIEVAPKKLPTFKVGKELKERVDQPGNDY